MKALTSRSLAVENAELRAEIAFLRAQIERLGSGKPVYAPSAPDRSETARQTAARVLREANGG